MALQKIKPPQITDALIAEIVTKIIENFRPQKIILFGSQVWGNPGDWSDIDILVIMDYKGSSSETAAKISITARPRYVPMDILVRTPDEIEERVRLGDYFIQRILTKGKILYERRISESVEQLTTVIARGIAPKQSQ